MGSSPYGIAVGDFNGDGKQDLVVVNNGANTASIRLGNGTGGFTNAPDVSTGTNSNPQGVAVGDFNGDGKQDLAITNTGLDSVSIRLGNGDGTFTSAVDVPVGNSPGSYPVAVVVGDFNGDGKLDFATANQSGLTADITRKNLTVTGATAQSKVYDGTTTATITGATLNGVISGDAVTVSGGGTFADKNVGTSKFVTGTLALGGADAGNYSITQPAGITGNITAKSLSIAADSKVKAKGASDPAFTYTATGLISDDSISGSLARVAGESPGSYAITQNDLSAGPNYSTSYTGGTLVITGPVAQADTASREPGSTSLTIPLSTLLANDSRIDSTGATRTDNLSITGVTAGAGNSVAISGQSVVYTPNDPSANAPLIFIYTLSDGVSTGSGVVTVTTLPQLTLTIVHRSDATYNAGADTTSITIQFLSPPNQIATLQYTTALTTPSGWITIGSVNSTASGSYSVIITAAGDQTAIWNRAMFFRASR